MASENEVPEKVLDPNTRFAYRRGRFLGKGGFAKCYEFIREDNQALYAGKIVPKEILKSNSQKEKMVQEVSIHRTLSHCNLVKFYSSFEDANYFYIVLEICRRKSLMELHKRRQRLSEPEVRYYLKQIAEGCVYIHNHKVIHRDLKLGNIFLNDEMQVKLGDFGLATRLNQEDERKKTMCGTPNYIAPEILSRVGHSYEVDVWSVGCIVYTLLVGKPPFETSNLKETYRKIRKGDYSLPEYLSPSAKDLIKRLLCLEPTGRPTMTQVLEDKWLIQNFIPEGLPISALTTMPRFDKHMAKEGNENLCDPYTFYDKENRHPFSPINQNSIIISSAGPSRKETDTRPAGITDFESITQLYKQVVFLLDNYNRALDNAPMSAMHESEHPNSAPVYWISKWVDYSDRYGLAYQLCDNSVGVLFNDHCRLLMTANDWNLQYITPEGVETLCNVSSVPPTLVKKLKLMQHFKQYMEEFLIKAGEKEARPADDMARLPYMTSWFRTSNSIVLNLSNGTLQVNIFDDHTKLILCPLMSAITYIDGERNFRTYKMQYLRENGIVKELSLRLQYVKAQMEIILRKRTKA